MTTRSFLARLGVGVALLLPLSACVTLSEQRAQLAAAPVCCGSYALMPYLKVGIPETRTVKFDSSSPAYIFESGKSFFIAFELPVWTFPYEVEIRTKHTSAAGIFRPRIKLIGSDFQTLRTFGPEDRFGRNPETIEFFVNQENQAERYMIVYSDSAGAGGKEGLHVAPIIIPVGPVILNMGATEHRVTVPYSPMGEVSLSLKPYAPRGVGAKS